jgi:valyl-tRNA synthetase
MPFITEEISQQLVERQWAVPSQTLQHRPWPQFDPAAIDLEAEAEMALLIGTVRALRNMRAELRVEPGKVAPEVRIRVTRDAHPAFVRLSDLIARLGRAERITLVEDGQIIETARSATAMVGENQVILPFDGFGDVLEREVKRLQKEVGALEQEQTRIRQQLSNESFVSKAPAAVVDKIRARGAEVAVQRETLERQLAAWSNA